MKGYIKSGLRYLSAPLRRKPDYLIIGAQKSGTSTLFQLLSDHPDIHNPFTKEIHYFDWRYNHSFFWYKSRFPINKGKITGEATPIYLFHPHIPLRVKKHLPNIKFIIILRNPVDRAYAHYQMVVRKGHEGLSFEEAIKKEPGRIAQALVTMENTNSHFSLDLQRLSYISRGRYVEQIERWFELFSESNFHILSFEELIENTQVQYDSICHFLNIETIKIESIPRLNMDIYPEMTESTRQKLSDYFRPYNSRLFELIGAEYPWDQ